MNPAVVCVEARVFSVDGHGGLSPGPHARRSYFFFWNAFTASGTVSQM